MPKQLVRFNPVAFKFSTGAASTAVGWKRQKWVLVAVLQTTIGYAAHMLYIKHFCLIFLQKLLTLIFLIVTFKLEDC